MLRLSRSGDILAFYQSRVHEQRAWIAGLRCVSANPYPAHVGNGWKEFAGIGHTWDEAFANAEDRAKHPERYQGSAIAVKA